MQAPKVRQISENQNELISLSLVADVARKSPSDILEIRDGLTAFALNSAVMRARFEWENKRDLQRLDMSKMAMRQAISEAFGGEIAKPFAPEDEESNDGDGDQSDEVIITI